MPRRLVVAITVRPARHFGNGLGGRGDAAPARNGAGPRSATVTAACDTECLATSYQEFIAAIQENPERAVGFMKTLVRRLRKMNELLESVSPEGRGFRAMLLECQPSVGSPEAAALSWTMLW